LTLISENRGVKFLKKPMKTVYVKGVDTGEFNYQTPAVCYFNAGRQPAPTTFKFLPPEYLIGLGGVCLTFLEPMD